MGTDTKQKIETACKIAGITVTELGARMGMSQQTISYRLKTGKFRQDELEKSLYFDIIRV